MAQGASNPPQTIGQAADAAFRSTRVVTAAGVLAATVLVKGGRIVSIRAWDELPADAKLRDFGDAVLLPGLVDTHVHINEPGRTEWEGFQTATRAAAAGGVTTLVDMPLNCIPETISVSALEAKRAASTGKTWVDWMAWGGVVGNHGTGGNEAELAGLIDACVPGFKCFQVHSGIDGFAWVDEAQLRKALGIIQGSGLPLLAHAEVGDPVERATAEIHAREPKADWREYSTYLSSRPDEAEVKAIAMLIRLAEEFQTPIHIVHLASAKALPLLREARQRGLRITVETCPQYLWFDATEIPDGATQFKCAPPIRDAANREALWQALFDGTIDLVATDHSPCPPALKVRETGRFDQAWGGISSLGLALSVIWTALSLRTGEASLDSRLALLTKWLAAEPARLAGLAKKKGALAVGCDADIVVFDPESEWTVREQDVHLRHKLSPYLGAKFKGRVRETFLRGESIFSRQPGQIEFSPIAQGRELRRNL